jgi:hypothetical protein
MALIIDAFFSAIGLIIQVATTSDLDAYVNLQQAKFVGTDAT